MCVFMYTDSVNKFLHHYTLVAMFCS